MVLELFAFPVMVVGLFAFAFAFTVTVLGLFAFSVRQQTDAAARARLLLHEWLSPAQRTQYAASGGFVVTGCDSGKSYRIQWGFRNFNVFEMDGKRIVARWCFQPSGGLVTADVVLAQKIALETREFEALKLANRDPPRVCTCLNIAAPAVPALSTAPLPQYRS